MKIEVEDLSILKAKLINRPLALFGAGGAGLKIAEFCAQNDISVNCFCDNAKTEAIVGLPVVSPEILRKQYPEANVIISSIIHFSEMESQLLSIGFNEQQILSYDLFMSSETTWMDLEGGANWNRMKIRVRDMAQFIDSDDKSVIDYGAGEMYLKTLLSDDVEYYPVDYIKRSPDMIVCDLNTGQFPQIQTDVSFLSGILDIVKPVEELIHHICINTKNKVILSYMVVDNFPDVSGRRTSAYVTDYSTTDVIAMFSNNGFELSAKRISPAHDVDMLFCFKRGKGGL